MSTYSTVYQALTSGRALRADEAALLLTRLRRETAEELAVAAEEQLVQASQRTVTDTEAALRRKRRDFAAGIKAIGVIRRLAGAPARSTITHRSTS
ncbi:hypothetical protein AB0465_11485 [Streptomyces griseoviridis]|uniref:hypothetical protein n=1 Tax=Streptomyces griseoviridis TaxID=45398 RepID=UPI00344DDE5B